MKKNLLLVVIFFTSVTAQAFAQYPGTQGNPSAKGGITIPYGGQQPQVPSQQTNQQNQTTTITIQNYQFTPAEVFITPGTSVMWTNNDSASHTVTADNAQDNETWDSGTIAQGQTFTKIFQTPGNYPYHCTIHPNMKAIIRVGNSSGGNQPSQGTIPNITAPPDMGQNLPQQGGIPQMPPGMDQFGAGGTPRMSQAYPPIQPYIYTYPLYYYYPVYYYYPYYYYVYTYQDQTQQPQQPSQPQLQAPAPTAFPQPPTKGGLHQM